MVRIVFRCNLETMHASLDGIGHQRFLNDYFVERSTRGLHRAEESSNVQTNIERIVKSRMDLKNSASLIIGGIVLETSTVGYEFKAGSLFVGLGNAAANCSMYSE